MCMFSGRVSHVSSTNIFARAVRGGRQVLAYEMSVSMTESVAMVLPLPVPMGTGDDAVRFIDVSGCRDLFAQLVRAFPEPVSRGAVASSFGTPDQQAQLVVHEVGDYEASFVPTMADFGRLDARFRMSDQVWSELPRYADYGFAVFKLAMAERFRPSHPIAFEFPSRGGGLYFPTVHIHGGVVEAEARFDHTLYAQVGDGLVNGWRRSERVASEIISTGDHAGLLEPDQRVHQRKMVGFYENDDVRL